MESKMSQVMANVLRLFPALQVKFEKESAEKGMLFGYLLEAREGNKFVKICIGSEPRKRPAAIQSVFLFVDKATGDVFKPASFNVPAKIARYNIATEEGLKKVVDVADPYGSFLYLKR
jgi:hypothetical protein